MAAPWFKFYAADYLLDAKVDLLPLEAQGILVRLWCLCSRDGSIPKDLAAISRRSGVDRKALGKHWAALLGFFIEGAEGYISERMAREALAYEEKCQKLKQSASIGGKQSAKQKVKQMLEQKEQQMLEQSFKQNPTEEETEAETEKALPPYAPPGAPAAPEVPQQVKPERAKRKGRDFKLAELEMNPAEEAAFERVWSGWPKTGWNFQTRSESPRRIHRSQAAERFMEILKHFPYTKGDGTRITPDDLASAALEFVAKRRREAGGGPPNVPCIDNFFSSVENQKHPWKDAIQDFFATEVAS